MKMYLKKVEIRSRVEQNDADPTRSGSTYSFYSSPLVSKILKPAKNVILFLAQISIYYSLPKDLSLFRWSACTRIAAFRLITWNLRQMAVTSVGRSCKQHRKKAGKIKTATVMMYLSCQQLRTTFLWMPPALLWPTYVRKMMTKIFLD
jgi:hypothetical protein